MLSKKTAWIVLIGFFIFDAGLSYLAITRMNGHEADLLIAWAVERYPLLYFFSPPGLILIMYCVVRVLTKLLVKALKTMKPEVMEKLVLTGMVIYWAVGNSFMNLSFLLGPRLSVTDWYQLTALGVGLGALYVTVEVRRLREQKL